MVLFFYLKILKKITPNVSGFFVTTKNPPKIDISIIFHVLKSQNLKTFGVIFFFKFYIMAFKLKFVQKVSLSEDRVVFELLSILDFVHSFIAYRSQQSRVGQEVPLLYTPYTWLPV